MLDEILSGLLLDLTGPFPTWQRQKTNAAKENSVRHILFTPNSTKTRCIKSLESKPCTLAISDPAADKVHQLLTH